MTDNKKAKAKKSDQTPGPEIDGKPIPSLFATIHWQSPERPDGYTSEEVEDINRQLNEDYERRKADYERRKGETG